MALAINVINRHGPRNKVHRQLQPKKTKVNDTDTPPNLVDLTFTMKCTVSTVGEASSFYSYVGRSTLALLIGFQV